MISFSAGLQHWTSLLKKRLIWNLTHTLDPHLAVPYDRWHSHPSLCQIASAVFLFLPRCQNRHFSAGFQKSLMLRCNTWRSPRIHNSCDLKRLFLPSEVESDDSDFRDRDRGAPEKMPWQSEGKCQWQSERVSLMAKMSCLRSWRRKHTPWMHHEHKNANKHLRLTIADVVFPQLYYLLLAVAFSQSFTQ